MALMAKAGGEARKLVPAGNYFGVCIGVYDIGTQPSEQYDPTHKVILQFELHRKRGVVKGEDDKPLTISGFFPFNFGKRKDGTKSKLRQAVEGILGRSFTDDEAKVGYDITQLVERACRLKIAHEEKGGNTYDTIETFMPLDEDDDEPQPELSSVAYEMDTQAEIPDEVPDWVKKQVRKSAEWVKVHGKPVDEPRRGDKAGGKADRKPATVAAAAETDDDIPF